MLFSDETFSQGNIYYGYKKPNVCPKCGIAINASVKDSYFKNDVFIAFFECTVSTCKKKFFAVYQHTSSKPRNFQFLYMYPELYQPELSKLIRELSPRCVELYNQAAASERLNHFDLAACGYRNAIEVLLKDFAIRYKNINSDNLKRKTLSDCIKAYLTGLDETIYAQVIKDFANNHTHYPPDDEAIAFDDFRKYLDLLLNQVEGMIRIRSFEKNLPPKLQQKFGLPVQEADQLPDTI